jgi:hypothetical protein
MSDFDDHSKSAQPAWISGYKEPNQGPATESPPPPREIRRAVWEYYKETGRDLDVEPAFHRMSPLLPVTVDPDDSLSRERPLSVS